MRDGMKGLTIEEKTEIYGQIDRKASSGINENHPSRSLNMYDKTLYLQRIFFAIEKTAKYEQDEIDGSSRIIKGLLKDADIAIDTAIANLEEVLICRKVFPKYETF